MSESFHLPHSGARTPLVGSARRTTCTLRAMLGSVGIAACVLSGCSSGSPTSAHSGSVEQREFRRDPASGDAAVLASADGEVSSATTPLSTTFLSSTSSSRPIPVMSPAAAGAFLPTAAVAMEPIARVDPAAGRVGEPVIIESLVGQMNGKPIYAGEFLRPLDRTLAAEAALARSGREWIASANKSVRDALTTQLQNELILAEARSVLTSEERAGLFSLLGRLRENLTTTAEGSTELANERLLAEEGTTLEEKAQDERDKILIRMLVSRYISPRAGVTWKDVQREYARNASMYNPLPIATVRLIWAPKLDTARSASISKLLAEKTTFETVARDRKLNDFNAGEGGLLGKRTLDPGSPDAKLVEDTKVNDRAVTLAAGEFAGPIESGSRMIWVAIESIDQPPSTSLEEAQLEIASRLRDRKFRDETARFFERLIEQGSKTDMALMNERLMLIAADRYGDKIGTGRPAAPAGIQRTAPAATPAAPVATPAAPANPANLANPAAATAPAIMPK